MSFVRSILAGGIAAAFAVVSTVHAAEEPLAPKARIVSVGGAVTETLYALGLGDQLVGTDSTSTFPEAATKLPQVGYSRGLSAEGILSLKPDAVLHGPEAGPAATLEQLKKAGVRLVPLPGSNEGVAGATARIKQLGELTGHESEAAAMLKHLEEQVAAVKAKLGSVSTPKKVLFVYARAGGILNIAGAATAAQEAILMAGGVNAVSGFEGYRTLTAEGVIAAAPDVVLYTNSGLEGSGGIAGVQGNALLAAVPAVKEGRILAMDDLLLLGFGPRTGEAAGQLAALLYPEIFESKPVASAGAAK